MSNIILSTEFDGRQVLSKHRLFYLTNYKGVTDIGQECQIYIIMHCKVLLRDSKNQNKSCILAIKQEILSCLCEFDSLIYYQSNKFHCF